jgi:hypothetical protein
MRGSCGQKDGAFLSAENMPHFQNIFSGRPEFRATKG